MTIGIHGICDLLMFVTVVTFCCLEAFPVQLAVHTCTFLWQMFLTTSMSECNAVDTLTVYDTAYIKTL